MSEIAASHRNLERPMTSARAPAKVISAFTDLVAPPAADYMQKLGAYCLGGRRAELSIDMTDPILQNPDSVLSPIAAAANLIILDLNRISSDIKNTLIYKMLHPFYGTRTQLQIARINYGNQPGVVLDPIPDRRGLSNRLQNFIRQQLAKPRYGRLPRNDARIWRAYVGTTPMLPFNLAGGMTPLRMHLGDDKMENYAYHPQADDLKDRLLQFVRMYDQMNSRANKETYLSSQFNAVLTSEGAYLYNSLSMFMRTLLRGWENLDLLPPLDGAIPGALNMDHTQAFVLPFTGAVSFICYGIQDDGLEYVPWFQRKEIPVPSSFPLLVDMEVRVANEIIEATLPPNAPFSASDLRIYSDEFLDMAEFILKKYLTNLDGGEYGTRHRLKWYLIERTVIHANNLATPGIGDLKNSAVLNDITYPEDIADKVYIKTAEDGVKSEAFVRWMRPAALGRVWNAYGWLLKDLHAGENIELKIHDEFVTPNGSSKMLVLTERNLLGGRHDGLGLCFMVCGVNCFGMMAVALFMNSRMHGHKTKH
jgi:hypothetical protein